MRSEEVFQLMHNTVISARTSVGNAKRCAFVIIKMNYVILSGLPLFLVVTVILCYNVCSVTVVIMTRPFTVSQLLVFCREWQEYDPVSLPVIIYAARVQVLLCRIALTRLSGDKENLP